MEEPFHAPDLLTDHVIRHRLAREGVKVSLSGIGGDELFAGYGYYRFLRVMDLRRQGLRWHAAWELLRSSETTPLRVISQSLLNKLFMLFGHRHEAVSSGFMSQAIAGYSQCELQPLPESCDERLLADLSHTLLHYWLRAGDKSSMAVPIEVRYPFLDHRLIEFACRLPVDFLIRHGWLKWLLRKAMVGKLPHDVIWRRQKMGFPFPISEWLKAAVSDLKLIFDEMDNPYLSRSFWTSRLSDVVHNHPWFVWRALSFELWHRSFIRQMPMLPSALAEQIEASRQRMEPMLTS